MVVCTKCSNRKLPTLLTFYCVHFVHHFGSVDVNSIGCLYCFYYWLFVLFLCFYILILIYILSRFVYFSWFELATAVSHAMHHVVAAVFCFRISMRLLLWLMELTDWKRQEMDLRMDVLFYLYSWSS